MPITAEQIPSVKWSELQECNPETHASTQTAKKAEDWLSKITLSPPRKPKVAKRKAIEHDNLLKAIESKIQPLRKKIAALERALKEPIAPEPDEFEKWIQSNEAQEYAGEFIALTSPGVVIAHSLSNDELLRLISTHPDRDHLVIDLVPSV